MSPIHKLLTNINKSSSIILDELNGEEPSFDVIVSELNAREKLVSQLTAYENQFSYTSFADEDSKDLKQKFQTFEILNRNIQGKAEQLLQLKKEKMATATKQRKAEQHYQKNSQSTNISYF